MATLMHCERVWDPDSTNTLNESSPVVPNHQQYRLVRTLSEASQSLDVRFIDALVSSSGTSPQTWSVREKGMLSAAPRSLSGQPSGSVSSVVKNSVSLLASVRRTEQTRLDPKQDAQAQAQWLNNHAKNLSLDTADELALSHPKLFEKLAQRWRETHPNKAGNFVQNAAIRAIVSRLYGKQNSTSDTAETSPDDRAGTARTHLADAALAARLSADAAGYPPGYNQSTGGVAGHEAKRAAAVRWKRWLKEFAAARGILLTKIPRWIESRLYTDADLGESEHPVFDLGPRVLKMTKGTGASFGMWPKAKDNLWTLDWLGTARRYLNKQHDANTLFGTILSCMPWYRIS